MERQTVPQHTNRLIHETSPYLLQHAHNPVNWYPWGEEALKTAEQENKPILVSIGYAACHWCHVMEKESFENEETARLMNERFVCIKIDREERPDLDHIYMDAVQAMTGSGGWPLNVFLTPSKKPFFGGTYFPPVKAYNRSSWTDVLLAVSQAFKERNEEINSQAENLTDHLLKSNAFGLQESNGFSAGQVGEAFQQLMHSADESWGGFGKAPKFPQTFSIQFLLRYYFITNEGKALQQARLSLDKMIEGGIYDQVGGGFARYSTDTEWLVPHFEKMLYDNALLISVLSEAYQLTKEHRYREVIGETIEFVERELMQGEGGFYAALDADSEGEEGKFYVWEMAEVKKLLGEEAEIFCRYYDISEAGNWEGKNILRVKSPLQQFAADNQLEVDQLEGIIARGNQKLLHERGKRQRPLLDDKIILGSNALMNTALSKAFMVTGKEHYRKLAIKNMQFLLDKFSGKGSGEFYHTWKNGQARYPAFLDDYAFLIQAMLHLQEISSDTKWIEQARGIMDYVIEHFSEAGTGFFFYTGIGQEDVIIRKKEVYDGAVPSGNAIMAYNLYQLSFLTGEGAWRERSRKMLGSLAGAVSRHPGSFGIWACLLQEFLDRTLEIAVVGPDHLRLKAGLFDSYLPHRVIMSSETGKEGFPLLAGKGSPGSTWIYLCQDFVCQQPVETIPRFMSLINRAKNAL